jgi:hypothetical protein
MLHRDLILKAFDRLSGHLASRGVVGEIALLGGTAMMFAFQARQATKDVDAIFSPAKEIRDVAKVVAGELGLPEDWLNDSAKAFVSAQGDYEDPGLTFPNLKIVTPTAEYMLAMKVLSARTAAGAERGDKGDIALLIDRLGLRNTAEVMQVVGRYYEDARLLPRAAYLVDEIFEERKR